MLKKLIVIALFTFSMASVQADWQVEDSRGVHSFVEKPIRVAALNWDIAEQVIELDLVPVAMPDIKGYQEWVVQPAIPPSVQDIGMRIEPNLERLSELKPDVIIVAYPQLDLISRLDKIAPVLYYETYNADHDNALAAIKNYKLLAKSLGKEDVATQKLAKMDARFLALKTQLNIAYKGKLPSVSTFRFASETTMYLYGKNSVSQYALTRLGITPAMGQDQPATQWGMNQKRLTELKNMPKDGVALYYQPFNKEDFLKKSVLWQAMPVVRENRVSTIDAVWSYGGAMSIIYNAEVLTKSLIALAPAE